MVHRHLLVLESIDNNIINIDINNKFQIYPIYEYWTPYVENYDKMLPLRNFLRVRDGNNCKLCNKELTCHREINIDHIIPYSKGGANLLSNLQLTHKKCNFKKGNTC